jgi:Putative prokaryotic signal transducing protein
VTDPDRPDDIVTLTRFGELPAAQLLCGRLESEGIECFIPDEIMAGQTWHLNRAIGGIRVQIRRADLDQAKQVLEQAGSGGDASAPSDGSTPDHRPGHNGVDDDFISPGDRAAYRSMRVALVSLWLLGLIHPYSLWLAVRALVQKDITAWGRRRAVIALVVSLVGCGFFAFLLARGLRR